jgi:protein SCO1/2
VNPSFRIVVSVAVALLVSLGVSCSRNSQGDAFPIEGTVAPFMLTDQDGQPFGTDQLKGRVWIADFFFTNCPGPCPRMSTLMSEIQKQTADIEELRIVSITVDPERDTPEAMKAYGQRYGAIDGRWHFLTGPVELLSRIALKDFRLFEVDGTLQHSTRFALIDRQGNIRSFYTTGEDGTFARLPEDVRKLIRQSDAGSQQTGI